MDAFYASIEQRDNPQYRGKSIAVGRNGERGVVAAASYEARRFGVRSAMSSLRARKLCPELIFVPSRMDVYKFVSSQLHEIFHEYTDQIEALSLDEAFLDVTENKQDIELAVDVAKAIKKEIREKLGLVASAGISYNKFLAKIASDHRKPDGLCTIHPDQALDFIATLPIESFWGVGKVTAHKMHSLGIHNGLQLRTYPLENLVMHFGKTALLYHEFANGTDSRTVEAERTRKSVGCERTFDTDLTLQSTMIIELYHVVIELLARLKKSGFKGNTLTLKVKFNDFTQKTRSITVSHELITKEEILPRAKSLLKELELNGKAIRLLGVTIGNPVEYDDNGQLMLSFGT